MQRTPHSFIKNAKEHKNVAFFWKERLPNPALLPCNNSWSWLSYSCWSAFFQWFLKLNFNVLVIIFLYFITSRAPFFQCIVGPDKNPKGIRIRHDCGCGCVFWIRIRIQTVKNKEKKLDSLITIPYLYYKTFFLCRYFYISINCHKRNIYHFFQNW